MDTNLKEKEVLIDIESDEGSPGAHTERDPSSGGRKGNVSLKRLISGVLSFNGSSEGEPGEYTQETTKLLADRNTGQGNVPLLEKGNERQKGGKFNKAAKPPRPPKGPVLDAADMRLLKEITKIAKRKQERMERIKVIKKMKAAKVQSPSSSSSSSSASSNATISAMIITGFFFLVILLQGILSQCSILFLSCSMHNALHYLVYIVNLICFAQGKSFSHYVASHELHAKCFKTPFFWCNRSRYWKKILKNYMSRKKMH